MQHYGAFRYMLITNPQTDVEITWLVVDTFINIQRLQGKRLLQYDDRISPMIFCVKPEKWKVLSEIHACNNYINEWIDVVY